MSATCRREPSTESVVIALADVSDRLARRRHRAAETACRTRWIVREVRNRYAVDARTGLTYVHQRQVGRRFPRAAPVTCWQAWGLECGPDVQKPKHAASHVQPEFLLYSLAGLIDVAAGDPAPWKNNSPAKHLQGTQAKLENPNFTDKAPAEVVEQQRTMVEDLRGQIEALENNLRELREG